MESTAPAPDSTRSTAPLWFVGSCLLGAAVIAAERWRFSIPVTFDMGIQLNGAQYLLAEGRLLSDSFATQGPDLSAAPEPVPLTWFPGGFSVVMAWLLGHGLSIPLALKTFDSLCLFTGWLGWALAGGRLLAALAPLARWHAGLAVGLGFLLPFTLSAWAGGTEGSLWAISPWFALLAPRLFGTGRSWIPASLGAGALAGLALNFRYAAAYLAVAWGLSLALLLGTRWRRSLAAGTLFGATLLLCYLPVLQFNAAVQKGGIAPPHAYQAITAAFLAERAQAVLGAFTKSACLLGLPPLDARLDTIPAGPARLLTGAVLLLVFGTALLLTARAALRTPSPARLRAWALLALPAGITLFLLAPSFSMAYNALRDGRYYMPAIVALPLLLLALPGLPRLRWLGIATLAVFAAVFTHDLVLARKWDDGSFPLNQPAARAPLELCSWPAYWREQLPWNIELEVLRPQFEVDRFLAAARPFEARHPAALRFVQMAPYFQYDRARSPYRVMPAPEYWRTARTTRAVELLFYVRDHGDRILTHPGYQPLVFSDHLAPTRLAAAEGWALYHLAVPADTPFFRPQPTTR